MISKHGIVFYFLSLYSEFIRKGLMDEAVWERNLFIHRESSSQFCGLRALEVNVVT